MVFGERHLRHVLSCYMEYYNATRTYLSLGKNAPIGRAIQAIGRIQCRSCSAVCITDMCEFVLRQGHPARTGLRSYFRFLSACLDGTLASPDSTAAQSVLNTLMRAKCLLLASTRVHGAPAVDVRSTMSHTAAS
jgi:hypothetical protein